MVRQRLNSLFPVDANDTLPLNWRRLLMVRSLVMVGELLALLVVYGWAEQQLNWLLLLLVVGLQGGLSVWALWQLQRPERLNARGFLWQLSGDVLLLLALFYLSGGAANPFVYLLLLPLLMTAAVLPRNYVWLVATQVMAGYSWLMLSYRSQQDHHAGHHQQAQQFDWHVLGMWFGFVFGVMMIVLFVLRMAESLRQREASLALVREQALRDEQLIALGTLAAGAAHELGTPLSTMAIVSQDLLADYQHDTELVTRLGLMRQQIERCKQSLAMISMSAGQLRAEQGGRQQIDQFMAELVRDWQSRHLSTQLQVACSGSDPAPALIVDLSLKQALFNLLDNAAQSSPQQVELRCCWQTQQIQIQILDRGPGVPAALRAQLGKVLLTTRPEGHGLGLLLAHAVIQRLGGQIHIEPREGGGTCVRLELLNVL